MVTGQWELHAWDQENGSLDWMIYRLIYKVTRVSRYTLHSLRVKDKESAKTSFVHSLKKILRAFFRFIHCAELRAGFVCDKTREFGSRLGTKKAEQMLDFFRGGGGEIRTPATGLPVLTI